MSAVDLRGLSARVDRFDSPESPKDRRIAAPHRAWLVLLLAAPLMGMSRSWLAEEEAGTLAVMDVTGPTDGEVAALPLHVNARVERWMEAFRTTRREELEHLLHRRGLFAEMILGKLERRSMPPELLHLAMIESGMFPNAVSRVSAVGLWQFMSPTATQYGLRVDAYVDERRDPVRATDAALDYLQYLHARFGSWYLAAAAFNAGPGRVERLVNRHAGGRLGDEDVYWQILEYLPRETREYIPKLIAVTVLSREMEAAGFDSSAEPYRYESVFVPGGTRLASIAQALEVDPRELAELNPHFVRGVTPPDVAYGVRVPVGRGSAVVSSLARAPWERRADD